MDNNITLGTLFHYASQNGYVRDREDGSDTYIDFVNRTYTIEDAFNAIDIPLNKAVIQKNFPDAKPYDVLSIGSSERELTKRICQIINQAMTESLTKFNQNHAALLSSGKAAILIEKHDPSFDYETYELSKLTELKSYYRNRPVYSASIKDDELKIKAHNIVDVWWSWKNRRQYSSGIVMLPGRNMDDAYNLFKGFGIEPRQGDWELFKELMFNGLCSGNQEHYEYLLDWMAVGVQSPDVRYGVSLVLRGGKGIGKGQFAKYYGRLFGKHYVHLTQEKHLTGHFNAHMADKLLVFADELTWGGNKSAEGPLKALITEDAHIIERKGFDAYPVKNFIRLIVASNEDWAVPAGSGERRYFIPECSDELKENYDFFNCLEQQMLNGGLEAMMYELMQRDIKTNQRQAPRTTVLTEIAEKGFSSVEQWLKEMLMDEALFCPKKPNYGHCTPVSSTDSWVETADAELLHRCYETYCNEHDIKFKDPKDVFIKKLKKILKLNDPKRVTINSKRSYMYTFPKLAEARKAFCDYIKLDIDWDQ